MKDKKKDNSKNKKKNKEFRRLIDISTNNDIPNGGFLNIIKCTKEERKEMEKNSDRAFETDHNHKIFSILDILNSKNK